MKKILVVCVLLGLAWMETAQAVTTYTWTNAGTGAGQYYANAANWDVGVPNSNADNVIINNGGRMDFGQTGTYTIGQFNCLVGEIGGWYSGTPNGTPTTLIVDGSNGLTGDFYVNPSGYSSGYQTNAVIDLTGNFTLGTGTIAYGMSAIMRGADKDFKVTDGAGYWMNKVEVYGGARDAGSNYGQGGHINLLKVKSTGSILSGNWAVHRLIVDPGGKIEGGRIQFIARGNMDNTDISGGKLVLPGGITFGGDVGMGTQYNGTVDSPLFVWKMDGGGDLKVRGSLAVGHDPNYGEPWYKTYTVLDLRDNGTGTPRNATILGGLSLSPGPTHVGQSLGYDRNGLLKCSTGVSTITVGGMVNFGGTNDYSRTDPNYTFPHGSADFGNVTMRVGGDWLVVRSPTRSTSEYVYQNWNPGTSTIIFDGNGTTNTQTVYTDEMPFNNVTVNTQGTVQLSNDDRDNWFVRGNLVIECGTFDQNGRLITFNGPAHLLKDSVGGGFDCISLLAGAIVNLGSNITMDNIDMGAGSDLYLNGFTLMTDGMTYDGMLAQTWQKDGGTIYGMAEIPEPATLLLMGTGALGALGYMRRRHK